MIVNSHGCASMRDLNGGAAGHRSATACAVVVLNVTRLGRDVADSQRDVFQRRGRNMGRANPVYLTEATA